MNVNKYLTGDQLRYARVKRKITIKQLSEESRVARSTISNFETGKNDIRLATAHKLEIALYHLTT